MPPIPLRRASDRRLFVIILSGARTIRGVVLFPAMRVLTEWPADKATSHAASPRRSAGATPTSSTPTYTDHQAMSFPA